MSDKILQHASVANGAYRKNLLINGGFDIWQRGESFNSAFYTADRWSVSQGGTNKSTTRGGLGLISAHDGSTFINVRQGIEWSPRFAGRTFTCSFLAECAEGVSLRVEVRDGSINTKTFNDIILDGSSLATKRADGRYEVTFALPATFTGTPEILLCILSGNTWAENTARLELGEIQLEIGGTATDFEYRPIGEELALCQRYYQEGDFFRTGPMEGTTSHVSTNSFTTEMRATPALGQLAAASLINCTGVVLHEATKHGITTYPTGVTTAGAHTRYRLVYSADAEL